jgi:hypothetical protein
MLFRSSRLKSTNASCNTSITSISYWAAVIFSWFAEWLRSEMVTTMHPAERKQEKIQSVFWGEDGSVISLFQSAELRL